MRSLQMWHALLSHRQDHALFQLVTPKPMPPFRIKLSRSLALVIVIIPVFAFSSGRMVTLLVPKYFFLGLSIAIQLRKLRVFQHLHADTFVKTIPLEHKQAVDTVVAAFLKRKILFLNMSINQTLAVNYFAMGVIITLVFIYWIIDFNGFDRFFVEDLIFRLIVIVITCGGLYLELRQNTVLGVYCARLTCQSILTRQVQLPVVGVYIAAHIITWIAAIVVLVALEFVNILFAFTLIAGIVALYGSRELIIWLIDRRLTTQ